jgi:hypothetical protein
VTAAVIALAGLAALLGGGVLLLVVRASGVKDQLRRAELLAQGEGRRADQLDEAVLVAHAEVEQLRSSAGRLEAEHRRQLDEVWALAARCDDPAAIRAGLRRVLGQESHR